MASNKLKMVVLAPVPSARREAINIVEPGFLAKIRSPKRTSFMGLFYEVRWDVCHKLCRTFVRILSPLSPKNDSLLHVAQACRKDTKLSLKNATRGFGRARMAATSGSRKVGHWLQLERPDIIVRVIQQLVCAARGEKSTGDQLVTTGAFLCQPNATGGRTSSWLSVAGEESRRGQQRPSDYWLHVRAVSPLACNC